jgi:hypothetical protein
MQNTGTKVGIGLQMVKTLAANLLPARIAKVLFMCKKKFTGLLDATNAVQGIVMIL